MATETADILPRRGLKFPPQPCAERCAAWQRRAVLSRAPGGSQSSARSSRPCHTDRVRTRPASGHGSCVALECHLRTNLLAWAVAIASTIARKAPHLGLVSGMGRLCLRYCRQLVGSPHAPRKALSFVHVVHCHFVYSAVSLVTHALHEASDAILPAATVLRGVALCAVVGQAHRHVKFVVVLLVLGGYRVSVSSSFYDRGHRSVAFGVNDSASPVSLSSADLHAQNTVLFR